MRAELIADAPFLNRRDIWIKRISKPRFDHPLHFHQCCELVHIQAGQGHYIIGDHVGQFTAGEVVLVGANLPHMWRNTEALSGDEETTQARVVYFSEELVGAISDDPAAIQAGQRVLRLASLGLRFTGYTRERLATFIEQIDTCGGWERLAHFMMTVNLIDQTQERESLVSSGYRNRATDYDLDRFTTIYQFLLANFRQPISLQQVADISNLTPTAFCRYFKVKTQKTFTRFVSELRIGYARQLLQDETWSTADISEQCGYNNTVTFFKTFKALTGKTPREYQQLLRRVRL